MSGTASPAVTPLLFAPLSTHVLRLPSARVLMHLPLKTWNLSVLPGNTQLQGPIPILRRHQLKQHTLVCYYQSSRTACIMENACPVLAPAAPLDCDEALNAHVL